MNPTPAQKIIGVLNGFDRLVFHGHLRRLCYAEGLEGFLAFRSVIRKDFGGFAQQATERVKAESLRLIPCSPSKNLKTKDPPGPKGPSMCASKSA